MTIICAIYGFELFHGICTHVLMKALNDAQNLASDAHPISHYSQPMFFCAWYMIRTIQEENSKRNTLEHFTCPTALFQHPKSRHRPRR